jgi:ribA/ribD-fused uncharacterized protein
MDDIRFYDPRQGPFCALSNLHPRALHFEGQLYATPEHAYQVLKAVPDLRAWLMAAPTPELVAVAGDALTEEHTVADWARIQLPLMRRIVRAKFDQDADLRELLINTAGARLVEWSPDDSDVARYWGEYEGEGENQLGNMLMALRDEYIARAR